MNLDEPDITIQVAVPGEWKTLKPGGEVFVDVSESIDHNDIIADIGKFLAGEALSECTLIYEENFASVPPHWWEGKAARSCC
jgi:hypothetical protein